MGTTTTLRPDQLAALARLHNRRTLYEIAITHPSGEKALVCYSDSKSQSSLSRGISHRADELHAWTRQPAGTLFIEWSRQLGGFKLSDGSLIRATGRTKRDVVMEDRKLPYIGDALKTA